MLRRKFFLVVAFIVTLILPSLSLKTFAWYCAFDDPINQSKCYYLRPSIDTIHTFAIYCCDSTVHDTLPWYYSDVWQMGGSSVPQFLWDNSRGMYLLSCHVISWGNYPIRHPTLKSDFKMCTGGGTDFATYIFQIADDSVDFKDYDADQDGIVDGFFFIIMNPNTANGCGCLGDFAYKTNDTTATGDTIWVLGQRGVEVQAKVGIANLSEFMHICIHEWGHQLGLVDLYSCG